MARLKELIEQLPPDLQAEVEDFVEFLLIKKKGKKKTYLKQDWAGGLSDLKEKYSSLGLEKESVKWRGD